MPAQALPRPGPYPTQIQTWPRIANTLVVGGAVDPLGEAWWLGATRSVFGVSGGAAAQDMQLQKELGCLRLTAGAGTFSLRQTNGMGIYLPLTVLTLENRFRYQEWQRVYQISHMLTRNASNPGTDSGVAFALFDGAAAGNYPSTAGVGAGFGIQGDGAGGWQWFSKPTVAGGFTDVTALAWPAGVQEWVNVRWELLGATPVAPASINLYLDATLVISKSWGPGSVLPDYTAIANANQWRYGMLAGSPNGLNLFLAEFVMMNGRFTSRDVELTNPAFGSL